MTVDEYCREVEAHLCRRNGGHLVRIVGPAFELVRDWAREGIPLKVALQGIDRRLERVDARGGSRRPVRVEFCQADVRDAFEQWRRAVGLRTLAREGESGEDDSAGRGPRRSLASHLERVVARLTVLRSGSTDMAWQDALEAAVRDLDGLLGPARKARGPARDAIVEALAAIDRRIMEAAARSASPEILAGVTSEAERDLEPFRTRLTTDAWDEALGRGRAALLRERLGLPVVVFD